MSAIVLPGIMDNRGYEQMLKCQRVIASMDEQTEKVDDSSQCKCMINGSNDHHVRLRVLPYYCYMHHAPWPRRRRRTLEGEVGTHERNRESERKKSQSGVPVPRGMMK